MTATHWIAIAAIITPLITSWVQYWLKRRSETSALNTATMATVQPKSWVRQHWKGFLILWLFNILVFGFLRSVYFREGSVTHHELITVAACVAIWAVATTLYIKSG